MKIKKILENDIDAVIHSITEIAVKTLGQNANEFYSYIRKIICEENGVVFIAENDYNVSGFICGTYTKWNMIGNIGLIAINENARKQGIGKALISAFEDWAHKNNVRKILVDTSENNKHAQIFYIKSGYVPEIYMPDYYSNGVAGINFAKKLITN